MGIYAWCLFWTSKRTLWLWGYLLRERLDKVRRRAGLDDAVSTAAVPQMQGKREKKDAVEIQVWVSSVSDIFGWQCGLCA